MFSRQHFDWPIRAQNHQPRWLASACNRRNQVERRWITPVQIFQVQNQRCFCGDHFERLGHLAQHSLLRRHMRESLQPSAILRANEARHLRQPRWGNSMQNLNQFLAAGLEAQSRQGLKYRQVRLARAILVDALPSTDPNCSVAHERIGERTRQRRLTDPWLTRDKDHSLRAAPGLFEPLVKLRQFCRASNHGSSGLYLPVGRVRPGCRLEPSRATSASDHLASAVVAGPAPRTFGIAARRRPMRWRTRAAHSGSNSGIATDDR
jgi:hypothetical protein